MTAELRFTDRWPQERVEALRGLWEDGLSMTEIAVRLGTTRNAIIGKSNRLQLQFHGNVSRPLADDARAVVEGRTRYSSRVQLPSGHGGVLKPGWHQRKLGPMVRKGPWRGMPIFSLTLEERATCPRTCLQWRNCYGNASGMSIRYTHGPELTSAIFGDLGAISKKHQRGFVVRLHQLGDFFSVEYVAFWQTMLDAFPGLRVFGYTARQPGDPIGAAVVALRRQQWHRFAIRTSGGVIGPRTLVVPDDESATKVGGRGTIVCPAQTGRTQSCSTCGLCWAPAAQDRPIAFVQH